MTLKELSEISSVSLNTIYSITKRDSERVDSVILQKLADALNVETSELQNEDAQGLYIAADTIQKAGLTIKDSDGKVVHQGDGRPFTKIPFEQVLPKISSPPESPEDQIVYFYSKLNTEGKQAAAICFFRHMKEEDQEIVRDYIKKLSEIPQFQQLEEDPDIPIDTSAEEKPDKE